MPPAAGRWGYCCSQLCTDGYVGSSSRDKLRWPALHSHAWKWTPQPSICVQVCAAKPRCTRTNETWWGIAGAHAAAGSRVWQGGPEERRGELVRRCAQDVQRPVQQPADGRSETPPPWHHGEAAVPTDPMCWLGRWTVRVPTLTAMPAEPLHNTQNRSHSACFVVC